jgi:phosphoglycerate dehydrogenase-like enzyme
MNGEPMRVVYWARLQLARQAITRRLQALPDCELVIAETLDGVIAALPGADALVLYDAPRSEAAQVVAALAAPGNTVRWMHFVSAGREGFEAVGLPQNLQITYAAGAVSPTVAEHAMALLLALGRRLPEAVLQQRDRRWDRALAACATSLEGGVLAIVGLGHIGIEVARRARAFGMHTVGLSRRAAPDALLDESLPLTDLHTVLVRADAVVVAVALTAQTRHLLGRAEFAAMKPGALLVNVARGGVVEPAALCEALQSGQLGGAGLDVTDPEPLPDNDPLWACPNVLISPHYAGGGSAASTARLVDGVADNLQRLVAGLPLNHVVTHA